ncbi:MAG TPA: hypothetical protein VHR66_06485 [Gemmataceae bacterium]|jgi:hypothetical protein|nr:hypothetical protein [Gemmataceae bacterium]
MGLFSRRQAARPAGSTVRLTCQQFESRIVPAMTLHKSAAFPHGSLLPHADVQSVYMGAGWTNDPDRVDDIRFFEGFTKFIVSSKAGYMAMLTKAKYGVGAGKSEKGFVDSTVNIVSSSISDAQIQAELQALITAGKVQQPNKNRLYQVFVAPTIRVTTPFGNSVAQFCAYHNSFAGTDIKNKAWPVIAYSVMPYQGTGTGLNGINAQNPDFASGFAVNLSKVDAITVAASHELTEAATDAHVGDGWWDENTGNENADVVNAQDCVLGGYVVQKNVAPDLTPIQPKNGIPYTYNGGGPLAAVTSGLVSAFTPESLVFNTSFGTKPKGMNWLVPGAIFSQNPAE